MLLSSFGGLKGAGCGRAYPLKVVASIYIISWLIGPACSLRIVYSLTQSETHPHSKLVRTHAAM